MREWEINRELLREPIIDIGAGKLPLNIPGLHVRAWDIEDGDAHSMVGIPDGSYQTVYSHHCLEHLTDPIQALRHWSRILYPGGILYVTVPSRKYYEKRRLLPSRFNADHKTFWLLDKCDPPNTFSLLGVFRESCPDFELISLRSVHGNHEIDDPLIHSKGDFHLEIVARKP